MTKTGMLLLLLLSSLLVQACSTETMKRATHGALEVMKQQDCQRSMHDDCTTESYDTYQRKREESTNRY